MVCRTTLSLTASSSCESPFAFLTARMFSLSIPTTTFLSPVAAIVSGAGRCGKQRIFPSGLSAAMPIPNHAFFAYERTAPDPSGAVLSGWPIHHHAQPSSTKRALSGSPQYSFAPAGMWGSTIRRWSLSSPSSWCTAEISMPQESMPIIGRGGRLVIAMQVFPTSSSGS